jgi:hypothetical protein
VWREAPTDADADEDAGDGEVADASRTGGDGRRAGAEMRAGTEFIGDFLFIE